MAETCLCPVRPLYWASCLQIRSGTIKDWSSSTFTSFLCQNFDYYTCDRLSVMPLIYLKYGTCVLFMLNCSFHRPNILKYLHNAFEATISHITPFTLARSKGFLEQWTHSYIFLTPSMFFLFLYRSRSFPRQRIEFCLRLR